MTNKNILSGIQNISSNIQQQKMLEMQQQQMQKEQIIKAAMLKQQQDRWAQAQSQPRETSWWSGDQNQVEPSDQMQPPPPISQGIPAEQDRYAESKRMQQDQKVMTLAGHSTKLLALADQQKGKISSDQIKAHKWDLVSSGMFTPEEIQQYPDEYNDKWKQVSMGAIHMGNQLADNTNSNNMSDVPMNNITVQPKIKGIPLTKPVQNKMQTDLILMKEATATLNSITDEDIDNYLGTGADLKQSYGNFKEQLNTVTGKFFGTSAPGPDVDPVWLQGKAAFYNKIGQLFQDYRTLKTGAQASDKELDRLEKIFINPNMAKSQFKGTKHQLLEKLNFGIKLKYDLLSKGLTPGTPTYNKMYDSKFVSYQPALGFIAPDGTPYTQEQVQKGADYYKMSMQEFVKKTKLKAEPNYLGKPEKYEPVEEETQETVEE